MPFSSRGSLTPNPSSGAAIRTNLVQDIPETFYSLVRQFFGSNMNRILLLSDADVHALKKSELQEFLKLFDAKTTDNKPELQERLKAYIRRANQSGSSRSLTDDDLMVVSQELDK